MVFTVRTLLNFGPEIIVIHAVFVLSVPHIPDVWLLSLSVQVGPKFKIAPAVKLRCKN